MDKQAFKAACDKIINVNRECSGIGTLGEKTLHAVLKHYYEPCAEKHEIKINGFVADIAARNGIVEIQTGNFNRLRKKLDSLLALTDVTVVYPIAHTKWLIWIDEATGALTKKHKSPKKGTPFDAYFELYRIKQQLTHPNFKLCLVFLDIDEYRLLNGWSQDKKRGSERFERIPVDIIDELYINGIGDYAKLIPAGLPGLFTTKDFKKASGLSLNGAQTALNILHHIGAVSCVGKADKLYLYERKI